MRVRCTGLCSLGLRWLRQALNWLARQVRELLRPLLARWAWSQLYSVLAGTTLEVTALASVRYVGMGSASSCSGRTKGDGAALASVCSVGVGSASHCSGGHDS